MLLHRIRVALFFVGLAVAVGYAAQTGKSWPPGLQQVPEESPPISPEEALKKFYMPPGYRVELVASEPLIQDPVMIDWDGEGRMWAVEMPGYMPDINAKGEHEPIGKVVVLEDTNNDGRMDKRTVFQDGFVLARWLKVLDRGVLVAEPPNLWLLQDTNGDLRADRKELVTSQYGRKEANVEHNANSLLWALDNNIYTSEIDIDLRLKNGKFDVRKTLSRGQWGITQDDAGRIFRNTNESALHVDIIPAHYYMRHPNLLRTRGSYESLTGPERPAQRGVADSSDARRQSRVSIRHPAGRRHAREIYVGVHADDLPRRSSAGRAVRQRVRRRSDRQSREPDHSGESGSGLDGRQGVSRTCAASFSPRPTSGSAP